MAGEKNETNVSKQYLFIKITIFILITERKMINMYQFIKVITLSIFDSENDCLELKINRIITYSFFTVYFYTIYDHTNQVYFYIFNCFLDSSFYFKTSFIFYLQINCYITFLCDFFFFTYSLYKNRTKYTRILWYIFIQMHNFKFNSAHIQFQLITIIHSQYMFIDIFYIWLFISSHIFSS